MGVTVLPENTVEARSSLAGGKQAFTSLTPSSWQRSADWPSLPTITATDNKLVGLVAVTNDDANFLALNATVAAATALTFDTTSTTSGSDSTDASTYTTASVTLTAGYTYILSVENSHGSDASAVSSITGSAASVPTFTSQATTQFNSNLNRVTLLTASPTATWTGTLTLNFGGTTQTGACWALSRVSGIGNLTNDGVIQTKTATGSSGTASVTLDNALATGSATFAAQGHAGATASTPRAGYTEVHDVTTATPAQALETQYIVAGDTTASATFTSAAWGIIVIEIRRGGYTVDWGDGVTDTVVTGTQANHQYTYSTLSTSVTTQGYKTATVTVTPNGYWTTCNLQVKHSQTGLNAYETGWLDITLSGPTLTTITIGAVTETVLLHMLERVSILSSAKTTYASQFQNCYRLQSVSVASSATVTSTQQMFNSCYALSTVPLFNTASVTNMSTMFFTCYSLQTVPLFNTASATSMNGMFSQCYALSTVPLFNTASVTNMSSMFSSCKAIRTVPLFNTASATNMNSMFSGCDSLQTVPLFNTAAVTNMGSMFSGTSTLETLPLVNTAAISSAANAPSFASLSSLAVGATSGLQYATSYASCNLSGAAIESIFTNLGKASGAQTITIGAANWGAPAVISKTSSGTTSGSTTVTMSDTSSLTTGMEISGTGISDAVAVTLQDTGDTVTRTAHGIPNDTPVSFATIVTTTGIATYTTYYVVNATANTFQVSDTVGGSAKALTSDGSGTVLYGTTISSIVANTSVTLSIPASATGSVTTSSALLKRSIARLKGWTVA